MILSFIKFFTLSFTTRSLSFTLIICLIQDYRKENHTCKRQSKIILEGKREKSKTVFVSIIVYLIYMYIKCCKCRQKCIQIYTGCQHKSITLNNHYMTTTSNHIYFSTTILHKNLSKIKQTSVSSSKSSSSTTSARYSRSKSLNGFESSSPDTNGCFNKSSAFGLC